MYEDVFLLDCKYTYLIKIISTIIVNGQWSKWGAFTKCTKTCSGGIRRRTRRCNNPAPKNGGKTCPGAAVQPQRCNTKACRK